MSTGSIAITVAECSASEIALDIKFGFTVAHTAETRLTYTNYLQYKLRYAAWLGLQAIGKTCLNRVGKQTRFPGIFL